MQSLSMNLVRKAYAKNIIRDLQNFGIIAGFSHSRRQDRHMVILGQFLVAGVKLRFVAVWRFHP